MQQYPPIPEELIEAQIRAHMAELGLTPISDTNIIMDGTLHRYAIEGDKSGETTGFYTAHADGLPAWCLGSWRGIGGDAGQTKVYGKFDTKELREQNPELFKMVSSPAWQKDAEKKAAAREKKRKQDQARASDRARVQFEGSQPAPEDHPYLVRKRVRLHGLHVSPVGDLMVPVRDVEGRFQTIQYIPAKEKDKDGNKLQKKNFPGAPVSGGFFSIAWDVEEAPILICEGYATGASLYEILEGEYRIACALSATNLSAVAEAIRKKFPNIDIYIAHDNDATKNGNPGLAFARSTAQKHGLFLIPFPGDAGDGSTDWNDYATEKGLDHAAAALREAIQEAQEAKKLEDGKARQAKKLNELATADSFAEMDAIKAKYHAQDVIGMRTKLDPAANTTSTEFIGGLFPRGKITAIIAAPGVGKTWFLQRFVSDISVGGEIFDGFSTSEPLKVLILAGEAGEDLLLERAKETQWGIKPDNVIIYDRTKCMEKGISIDLDNSTGVQTFEGILDHERPDVVFIDTLTDFHSVDENKASEMKPIIDYLLRTAARINAAIVIMHHTRKRKISEQNYSLTQDEAIGSSVLNRLVSLLVGLDPKRDEDEEAPPEEEEASPIIYVRCLKSWWRQFRTFSYRLYTSQNGLTDMFIDLKPTINIDGIRGALWRYIVESYEPGVWFTSAELRGQVPGAEYANIRKCLAEWEREKKLLTAGQRKTKKYSIPSLYHRN